MNASLRSSACVTTPWREKSSGRKAPPHGDARHDATSACDCFCHFVSLRFLVHHPPHHHVPDTATSGQQRPADAVPREQPPRGQQRWVYAQRRQRCAVASQPGGHRLLAAHAHAARGRRCDTAAAACRERDLRSGGLTWRGHLPLSSPPQAPCALDLRTWTPATCSRLRTAPAAKWAALGLCRR